jgi:hypothetical protein
MSGEMRAHFANVSFKQAQEQELSKARRTRKKRQEFSAAPTFFF